MKIKIRKLTKKDLLEFYSLFKQVLSLDFPELQPKIALIYRDYLFNKKYFINFFKKRKNCILGAFSKNKLIGFLVIYGHSGGVVEFIWLGIENNYRKKGIGANLLKSGERWALKNKFHHLYFHTLSNHHVKFYKKIGYEYVGFQKKLYFGVDEHLMSKVLRDNPFDEIFDKYLN